MYCKYCGNPLQFGNQQFCTFCGNSIQEKRKASKAGAVALALLKGAGFYALFYGVVAVMQAIYSGIIDAQLVGEELYDPSGYMQLSDRYWGVFSENYAYAMIASYLVLITVYMLIYFFRKKSFAGEIGLRKTELLSVPASFLFGVALQVLVVFIIGFVSVAIPSIAEKAIESEEVYNYMFGNASTTSVFFATAVVTPVLEEILFRGLIYTRMKKAMPKAAAMLLSALWFGFAHSGGAHQVAYAAVLGIIMVLIYEKYNSLWPCIFLHAGFNSTSFLYEFIDMNSVLVNWMLFVLSIGFVLLFIAYFFMSEPVYEEEGEKQNEIV